MDLLKKVFPSIGKFSLAATGFAIGLLGNQVANKIPQEATIIVLLFFLIISLIYLFAFHGVIEPNINVTPLRIESTIKRNRRKGLIILLSPFHIIGKHDHIGNLDEAIKNKDYKLLNLSDLTLTNYGPQIKSFITHFDKLEHCWIITTKTKKPSGVSSQDYLSLFVNYLEEEVDKNKKVKFHFDDKYVIDMTDDSAACKEASELIKNIFKEGEKQFKLKSEDIVVDVTGGTASLKIGATLACLAKNQYIQVIGVEYDKDTGSPKRGGELTPLIIGYKPKIEKEN